MTIADVLIRGGKQEISHVVDFATTPVGPFYTVDQMVATARNTVRNVGTEAGIASPFRGQLRGQLGGRFGNRGMLTKIRGRFPSRLRRY